MKANTKMTKSMAMVFILGLTAVAMKDSGGRANSTVWELMWFLKIIS